MHEVIPLFGFTHSGATLLVNILLELGIRICDANMVENFWQTNEDGSCTPRPYILNEYQCWFPRMQTQERFTFKEDLTVYFSHQLPRGETRAIMLTRDPIDTMYSYFVRENKGCSYAEWLERPNLALAHKNAITDFARSPLEEWALYYALIGAIYSPRNLCHVRFEDLKSDPLPHIKRVLEFIGIERGDDEIRQAIEASTFEKVEKAARKVNPDDAEDKWKPMRKGQVGEGHQFLDKHVLERLRGLPIRIAKRLHYEINDVERLPPIDMRSPPPMNALLNLHKERLRVGAAAWYYRTVTQLYGRKAADNLWGDLVYISDHPVNILPAAKGYASIGKKKEAIRLLYRARMEAADPKTKMFIDKVEQDLGRFSIFLRLWRRLKGLEYREEVESGR